MGVLLLILGLRECLNIPNEPPLPEGHTSGSGEGMMEHTFELMDIVPPTPHDLPLLGGYTPGSDKGRLKLYGDPQTKKRVKKLERQRKSSISHPRTRIYRQVESSDDDLDAEDASKQGMTNEGMAFVQEKDAENQGKIGADDTKVVKGNGDTKAVNTASEVVSTAAPRTPPT
ncbi:hypothetical protein Tco_1013335, partial [Tanacetum coccineum]